MKGKLYTVGIIAAIGLIGLGAFFIADKGSVYQEKDYNRLFIDLHRADIGDMYYRLLRADENGEIKEESEYFIINVK